ncbi:MAG TPA: dehydrogenase E1 component subunit alpha/beta [Bryobacteraceae bacterium]|nr:dehydrogenase E1 component subunit alpha/beta [Bryobacteraceae bacterium]
MAAISPVSSPQSASAGRFEGLDPDQLIRAFRIMHTARRLDDREVALKRQNRIYFQISGAGHEAVQVAAGMVVRPGYDWFYLYYRDRALCLTLGVTPHEMLQQAVGAAADPASGGRQMPSHWGHRQLNIVSVSSPTGTQFNQAVGCAEASRYGGHDGDEITMVSCGEGATSEGEFWEALNMACLKKLPLLFLVEDNGYAISVPIECQTAGGSISALASGFPGLLRLEVDGTDFLASYRVMKEAAAWAREGHGPAMVHAHVIRPYSHSLSDDERLYKPAAERRAESERDPVTRFPQFLVEEGVLDRQMLQLMMHEIDEEVHQATHQALHDDPPASETALRHLFSEAVDPTSEVFESEPKFRGGPATMVDLLNATLREEMRRNPNILVFGEDVADCSREGNLPEVKGKGGVFKVTAGLQRAFGPERSFNSPIAEAAIVGRAIGMATRGLKPIAEIQFFDYIWPAMMQLRDELATLRWRSNGSFSCPAVVRVAIGGYLNGGAIYHSQCGEVLFTHIPGLRVVMPSNALDACGLMRTALRADDPVMFLEHKRLYREPYNRSPHPGEDYTIPFGRAKVVKPGQSLTVVTYGALLQKSLLAATQVEKRSPHTSIEILDLRTLAPYDWPAIRTSVEKTNRVIVAHEDCLSFGYGAEIAARIADELFDRLDAPVRRVGALDTWVGYHPQLETAILPQTENLVSEMERLLAY